MTVSRKSDLVIMILSCSLFSNLEWMIWSRKKLRLIGKNRREREREAGKWIPFCIFGAFYGHSIPNYIGDNIGRRERGWRPLTCVKNGPHFRPCLVESHFSHLRTREWMEACEICVCQLHNCVPLDLIQEACIHKKRFSTSKSTFELLEGKMC